MPRPRVRRPTVSATGDAPPTRPCVRPTQPGYGSVRCPNRRETRSARVQDTGRLRRVTVTPPAYRPAALGGAPGDQGRPGCQPGLGRRPPHPGPPGCQRVGGCPEGRAARPPAGWRHRRSPGSSSPQTGPAGACPGGEPGDDQGGQATDNRRDPPASCPWGPGRGLRHGSRGRGIPFQDRRLGRRLGAHEQPGAGGGAAGRQAGPGGSRGGLGCGHNWAAGCTPRLVAQDPAVHGRAAGRPTAWATSWGRGRPLPGGATVLEVVQVTVPQAVVWTGSENEQGVARAVYVQVQAAGLRPALGGDVGAGGGGESAREEEALMLWLARSRPSSTGPWWRQAGPQAGSRRCCRSGAPSRWRRPTRSRRRWLPPVTWIASE